MKCIIRLENMLRIALTPLIAIFTMLMCLHSNASVVNLRSIDGRSASIRYINYINQYSSRFLRYCLTDPTCSTNSQDREVIRQMLSELETTPPPIRFIKFRDNSDVLFRTDQKLGAPIFFNLNRLTQVVNNVEEAAIAYFASVSSHHKPSDGLSLKIGKSVHGKSQTAIIEKPRLNLKLSLGNHSSGFSPNLFNNPNYVSFPHVIVEDSQTFRIATFGSGFKKQLSCPQSAPTLFGLWLTRPATMYSNPQNKDSEKIAMQLEYVCIDINRPGGKRFYGEGIIELDRNQMNQSKLDFNLIHVEDVRFGLNPPKPVATEERSRTYSIPNKTVWSVISEIQYESDLDPLSCRAYFKLKNYDRKIQFQKCNVTSQSNTNITIESTIDISNEISRNNVQFYSIELTFQGLKHPVTIYPSREHSRVLQSTTQMRPISIKNVTSWTQNPLSSPAYEIPQETPFFVQFTASEAIDPLFALITIEKKFQFQSKYSVEIPLVPMNYFDSALIGSDLFYTDPHNLIVRMLFPSTEPGLIEIRFTRIEIIDKHLRKLIYTGDDSTIFKKIK